MNLIDELIKKLRDGKQKDFKLTLFRIRFGYEKFNQKVKTNDKRTDSKISSEIFGEENRITGGNGNG